MYKLGIEIEEEKMIIFKEGVKGNVARLESWLLNADPNKDALKNRLELFIMRRIWETVMVGAAIHHTIVRATWKCIICLKNTNESLAIVCDNDRTGYVGVYCSDQCRVSDERYGDMPPPPVGPARRAKRALMDDLRLAAIKSAPWNKRAKISHEAEVKQVVELGKCESNECETRLPTVSKSGQSHCELQERLRRRISLRRSH